MPNVIAEHRHFLRLPVFLVNTACQTDFFSDSHTHRRYRTTALRKDLFHKVYADHGKEIFNYIQ
jgi:hypothetical protein